MAREDTIINHIKKWEGGFKNHPLDNGGATNMGITIKTYQTYYGKDKTVEDLKKMTNKEWLYIFKKGYYYPSKCHLILDDYVAIMVCEMCWMSGVRNTIKHIQRWFGLKDDGIIGKLTLGVLNGEPEEVLMQLYNMRKEWYEGIIKNNPSQKVFLKGWLNRLNSILEYKQKQK